MRQWQHGHPRCPEAFPSFGGALTPVAELACPSRHPLPELGGEGVERFLRYSQGFEPLVSERDRNRAVLAGLDDLLAEPIDGNNRLTSSRPAVRSSMRRSK